MFHPICRHRHQSNYHSLNAKVCFPHKVWPFSNVLLPFSSLTCVFPRPPRDIELVFCLLQFLRNQRRMVPTFFLLHNSQQSSMFSVFIDQPLYIIWVSWREDGWMVGWMSGVYKSTRTLFLYKVWRRIYWKCGGRIT